LRFAAPSATQLFGGIPPSASRLFGELIEACAPSTAVGARHVGSSFDGAGDRNRRHDEQALAASTRFAHAPADRTFRPGPRLRGNGIKTLSGSDLMELVGRRGLRPRGGEKGRGFQLLPAEMLKGEC